MLKLPNELTIAHIDVQFLLALVIYILAQGKTLQYQLTSKVLQESINQLGINDAITQSFGNEPN